MTLKKFQCSEGEGRGGGWHKRCRDQCDQCTCAQCLPPCQCCNLSPPEGNSSVLPSLSTGMLQANCNSIPTSLNTPSHTGWSEHFNLLIIWLSLLSMGRKCYFSIFSHSSTSYFVWVVWGECSSDEIHVMVCTAPAPTDLRGDWPPGSLQVTMQLPPPHTGLR